MTCMTRSEAGSLGGVLVRDRKWKEYLDNPRRCRGCSTPLLPKKWKKGALAQVRAKKFCSHRCAERATNLGRQSRLPSCAAGCGVRVKTGRSRYCSLRCQAEQQKLELVERWLRGEIDGGTKAGGVRPAIRNYLLKKAGYKCTECGWGKINPKTGRYPLHIDHVDGDSRNGGPGNLRVLCPNCHSLTPTYAGANAGKGRAIRRARYRKGVVGQFGVVGNTSDSYSEAGSSILPSGSSSQYRN